MKLFRPVLLLLIAVAGCSTPSLKPAPDELGEFVSREDYLQRLEPRGNRILHGAGPNPEDFAEYWEELERTPPVLYTAYYDLYTLREDWSFLLRDILAYYPAYVIPQIGLSMTQEGNPYEHLVARGEMDVQIDFFTWGLEQLGRPALVRIGYGFGSSWTGYRPEPYQQAWTRIAQAIRRHLSLENVAMVWCYAADSRAPDFMDYYPGDQHVDWWALDAFDPATFQATTTLDFVEAAREHGYPVLIGEAAPRSLGVEKGSRSWDRWFVPFFRFMRVHPNVKGFCYISWYAGHTRIAGDLDLLQQYRNELAHPFYQHAAPEEELRWHLEWEE